ncbi:hypothetical protein JCM11251_000164 [Rhodosporidiobolus azoricus]
MEQHPLTAHTAIRALTSAELVDNLVVAVDEQDVRFVCFWLQKMHEKGMLYGRNGKNGVDRPDTYGRSALTAIATADFSPLRQFILYLLLLNFDGDPAQATVFNKHMRELQEWACLMLHGWMTSGRREAHKPKALLRLDDARRSIWIAANLPPSPCPVRTGTRFLAPHSTQPVLHRTSPRFIPTSSLHLPSSRPAAPSRSSSYLHPHDLPRPPLLHRSLSDRGPLSSSSPHISKSTARDATGTAAAQRPITAPSSAATPHGFRSQLLDPVNPEFGMASRSFRYLTPAEEARHSFEGDISARSSGDVEEGEIVTKSVEKSKPSPLPLAEQLAEEVVAFAAGTSTSTNASGLALQAPVPLHPPIFNPVLRSISALSILPPSDTRLNSSPYPSPEPSPPPASHPSKLAHSRKLSSPPPPSLSLSPVLLHSTSLVSSTDSTSQSDDHNPFAGIFALPFAASPVEVSPATVSAVVPSQPTFPSRTSSLTLPPTARSAPKRKAPSAVPDDIDREYKKRRQVRWPTNEGMIAVVVGEGAGWEHSDGWEEDVEAGRAQTS